MEPIIKKEQQEEFFKLARPLIEFLNRYLHPHAKIIITTDYCEIVEGLIGGVIEDYIPS
jgi:hypothetical protein